MNSLQKYTLVGFQILFADRPGFVIPVYEKDDVLYAQDGRINGVVTKFVLYSGHEKTNNNLVYKLDSLPNNRKIKFVDNSAIKNFVGSEFKMGFVLDNDTLLYGTCSVIRTVLSNNIQSLDAHPFVKVEVADFLNDSNLSKVATDHASDLLTTISREVADQWRSEQTYNLGKNGNIDNNFLSKLAISFPRTCTAGEVEKSFGFHSSFNTKETILLIDLSLCEFIEPAALLLTIAYLHTYNCYFEIALPKSRRVRDFLRIWEFPEAISAVFNRTFFTMVRSEDREYFGESVSENSYYNKFDPLRRLLSNKYYGINNFFPKAQNGKKMIMEESERWRTKYVMTVLENHLNKFGRYLGSHVTHEAMANSFLHPKASIVQTTSLYQESSRNKGHFSVSFYDNGTSIIQKLRQATLSGTSIRSINDTRIRSKYLLQDATKSNPTRLLSSFDNPSEISTNSELLVASTFPGITSTPNAKYNYIDDEILREDDLFKQPGMGLFILISVVVDMFKGTLILRTGDLLLELKPSSENDITYRAKVTHRNPIKGNFLTARIPLKNTDQPTRATLLD